MTLPERYDPLPGQDILGMFTNADREIKWVHGDDLCDCTFQRIGFWTNPYIARTYEVRLCCMWADLGKMFPDNIREINASTDLNTGELVDEPMVWNGEADMPRDIWYRQLAVVRGESLETVREKFADIEPPKGVKPTKTAVIQMFDSRGNLFEKEVTDAV